MTNKRILRVAGLGMMLAGLSACSTIKSWFPDKERDYQFTTEIPELVVPDDLKNKGLTTLSPAESAPVPEAGTSPEPIAAPSGDVADNAVSSEQAAPAANDNPAPAQAVGGAVSSLQIDQGKTQATRLVGKALTRQKIEVVERNIEKGYFYVKYDPDAVEAKDDSIWDELNFIFGGDPSQEKEYRIAVRELNPQMSEVTVQNEAGKPLADGAANALLRLITEGINQTLNQPDSTDDTEPEPKPESEAVVPAEPEIRE